MLNGRVCIYGTPKVFNNFPMIRGCPTNLLKLSLYYLDFNLDNGMNIYNCSFMGTIKSHNIVIITHNGSK